jgi:signal transduction histidine kinase
LRDAESRTQLETQLDVSRRVTAISRLTAGVAHEIKNPLNAMAVHLEILKSKAAGLDDKTKVELDVLEREIGRLDRVVKTFLDFTRPIELKMDAVDLGELAAEVSGLVSLEAARRRVVVEAPAGANGVVVRGDRDLLRQALINIVVNGVEAMQNGGALRIRTEGDGGQCLLEVSDDGPGIPPEVREKIFNLYFTTKPNGSGIGLAIAFRVVQLHNGKIEVVSKTGEGTSFRLVFPAWEPKTAAA